MLLHVGRIGRPHGIRGELTIEVRTDSPEERFAAGSQLETEPAHVGPLTVERAHWHSGRLLVSFVGVDSREAAESLRDTILVVDSEDFKPLSDPDEFYDHQLIGLRVVAVDGTDIGEVADVIHGPAGELLAITRLDGVEVSVPFLRAMVPTVDVAAGRVVIDPPAGLLELPDDED